MLKSAYSGDKVMKLTNTLAAFSILTLSALGVNAATLTGDDVTLEISDVGFSQTVTVGAGTDFTANAVSWDVDFGADGDELNVSVIGDFPSFGATSFELSSLDFSGGEFLTGFANLFSQLQNTSFSLTDSSILFTFDDGPVTNGTVLSGRFETAAPIPLPAGVWLLLTSLGGLAVVKRRKRHTA